MTTPRVTVLMSVHNGLPYLSDAIQSVLTQTVQDLEFVIVDDASTDGSSGVIDGYAAQDNRVQVVRNAANLGLTCSLNVGLGKAAAEYVARIDADDFAYPSRLHKQYEAITESSSDICFCGADIEDIAKRTIRTQLPLPHHLARWRSLFVNAYGLHSAVMFRSESILSLGGYDETYECTQDYELWDRCAASGLKFCHVSEPLIRYRYCPDGISVKRLDTQEKFASRVSERALLTHLPELTPEACHAVRAFMRRKAPYDIDTVYSMQTLGNCEKLARHYCSTVADSKEAAKFVWKDYRAALFYHMKVAPFRFRPALYWAFGKILPATF